MRKHELDALSVFFGVVFAGVGAAFLFTDVQLEDLGSGWVVPTLALAIGLIFLSAAVRRTKTEVTTGETEEMTPQV